VVTRNVSDFEPTGVPVLNPFDPRRIGRSSASPTERGHRRRRGH
jgi:hypothetical protein